MTTQSALYAFYSAIEVAKDECQSKEFIKQLEIAHKTLSELEDKMFKVHVACDQYLGLVMHKESAEICNDIMRIIEGKA